MSENRVVVGGVSYWAPEGGGYVRRESEGAHGTLGAQVYDAEGHIGETLRWDPAQGTLLGLVAENAAQAEAQAAAEYENY